MTLVRLRRRAPEAQSAKTCSVCGTRRMEDPKDHLLVGTPGVPSHDGAVCSACGAVIERVVEKFGQDLDVTVEQAQREVGERDVK